MSTNLLFKRGLLSNLSKLTVKDGTIYITTDEKAMYLDYGTLRIRLGDFIPVNAISDLPIAGHAYETAMYYVKEGNILTRWDKTNNRWILINKAGIVGVQTSGSGNIVSEITTQVAADGTLQLVVTKTTVASTLDLSNLASRVTTNESNISSLLSAVNILNGDESTNGSLLHMANSVLSTLLGSETQYKTFKAVADELRGLLTRVSSAETNISNISGRVSTLESTVSGHTSTLSTLTGDSTVEGSIDAKIAAEATARSSADTALSNRIDSLGTSISNLSGRVTTAENAITILNSGVTTAGSVAKQVADAIAAVVAEAPEDFDTLKEISDWISEHPDDSAALNSALLTLSGRVTTLETSSTSMSGRLDTAENDIDTLEAAVTLLNNNDTTVGSVDYKIKTAIATILNALTTLNGQVTTNSNNLTTLMGDASTTGSIAYNIAAEAALRLAADNALDSRLTTAEGSISTLLTGMGTLSTMVNNHENCLTWIDFGE